MQVENPLTESGREFKEGCEEIDGEFHQEEGKLLFCRTDNFNGIFAPSPSWDEPVLVLGPDDTITGIEKVRSKEDTLEVLTPTKIISLQEGGDRETRTRTYIPAVAMAEMGKLEAEMFEKKDKSLQEILDEHEWISDLQKEEAIEKEF
ncbi:hypothetical protein AKJ58_01650 [candidate division MSBL1 archaeon SCGC-AAA385D11]|uniref:Uncharacterized protein n=1 Tax=candidate division MSBL1 archaeon SCGC-AAA385D11 TaxID=1698286 RepID=A0A133VN15_9EURY|nr:hypothetical protein AKJ58_01650 [candidate division MSBL1 archaeon SCGC-AAA385D11]